VSAQRTAPLLRACTSICSLLDASLVTEAPHANFLPNFFDASASFTPNRSSPMTVVMHLRLFRVARSMSTWPRARHEARVRRVCASAQRPACVASARMFRGTLRVRRRQRRRRQWRARACFLDVFLPPLFFFGASPSAASPVGAWRAGARITRRDACQS
jgi:hypothetical protein